MGQFSMKYPVLPGQFSVEINSQIRRAAGSPLTVCRVAPLSRSRLRKREPFRAPQTASLSGRFIAVVRRASKGSFTPLLAPHSSTAKHRDDEINWRSGHDRLAPGKLKSAENVYRNGLAHHRKLPWQVECPQGESSCYGQRLAHSMDSRTYRYSATTSASAAPGIRHIGGISQQESPEPGNRIQRKFTAR